MRALADGKILVTGGAGFIGSALIARLNQHGLTNILVADYLGHDEKWQNLVPLRFDDYIEADALRSRLTTGSSSLEDITTVFHLGACSATTEKNAAYLIDNNFAYTKDLATWALSKDARFIYASSAATYGNGSAGMDDTDDDLARLRPLNMYGYSKHLFDVYARRHGLLTQITGLKYFNVFGPNENHKGEMRSLVNKAFHQIQQTGRIELFKSYHPEFRDGEQMRDFLYIKDAVEATLHFADTAREAAGLYNVGSGMANTWLALAHAIFKALGREPNIEFIEMPAALKDKYQYYTRAEIGKLAGTGYSRPPTPLTEAVGDYIINYLLPGRKLGDQVGSDQQ